jgi:hypothetical protein
LSLKGTSFNIGLKMYINLPVVYSVLYLLNENKRIAPIDSLVVPFNILPEETRKTSAKEDITYFVCELRSTVSKQPKLSIDGEKL